MQRKIRFTRKVIENLPPCPPDQGGREVEYTSLEAPPGLRLVVTRRGLKSWLFRYTMPMASGIGLKRAIKIGVFPGLEPGDACRIALDLRAQISQGIDPQHQRQEVVPEAEEPTLETFFRAEYWPHAKTTLKSADDIESRWRLHISKSFGHLRFRDLKTADILRFHDAKRIQLCAATANRLLALLKRVINVAIMLERCERNPCKGVRMHPEMNIRRRTLAGEELTRFITSVAEEPNRVAADFFIFALATAARREECLQSTFSEFHLEEGVWRLPANRTKTSRLRVIPLNDIALQVLTRRRAETDGEFVFPGQAGKPLGNPTKAWYRTLLRAGISDLKMHDLRRSAATLLLNHGGSMTQAGNLLGHAPGSTLTATRYAFLGDEQMREASMRLSSVISAASAPASPAVSP